MFQFMSSGIYQRGEENEGVFGFLVEDIKREIRRSAQLVRPLSLSNLLLVLPHTQMCSPLAFRPAACAGRRVRASAATSAAAGVRSTSPAAGRCTSFASTPDSSRESRLPLGALKSVRRSRELTREAGFAVSRCYCPDHRPTQTLSVSSELSLPQSCSICLDAIQPVLGYGLLKCPCCHGSWFHRDCVQVETVTVNDSSSPNVFQ